MNGRMNEKIESNESSNRMNRIPSNIYFCGYIDLLFCIYSTIMCYIFYGISTGKETNAILDFVVDDEASLHYCLRRLRQRQRYSADYCIKQFFLTVGSKTKKNNDWTDIDGCAVAPIWDGPYGYWCGQNLWMDCWAPNRSIQWP